MTPAEFKSAREALGLTQTDVARWMRVGLRTVQYWEASAVPGPAQVLMQAWQELDWMAELKLQISNRERADR